MSIRKPHNRDAGYIAERRNPLSGGHTVIYHAEQQGIDAGGRYAVVCDAHGTICGTSSVPKARSLMKSAEFCEHCMALKVLRTMRLV